MSDQFDNTDPLQLTTQSLETPPAGGDLSQDQIDDMWANRDVLSPHEEKPLSMEDQMNNRLNLTYSLGYSYQDAANLAVNKGFDPMAVYNSVNTKMQQDRAAFDRQNEEALAELRANKQRLANDVARMERLSMGYEGVTRDDVLEADNEYIEAYSDLNSLEGWISILENPNATNAQLRQVEREIYEQTGVYFQGSVTDLNLQNMGYNSKANIDAWNDVTQYFRDAKEQGLTPGEAVLGGAGTFDNRYNMTSPFMKGFLKEDEYRWAEMYEEYKDLTWDQVDLRDSLDDEGYFQYPEGVSQPGGGGIIAYFRDGETQMYHNPAFTYFGLGVPQVQGGYGMSSGNPYRKDQLPFGFDLRDAGGIFNFLSEATSAAMYGGHEYNDYEKRELKGLLGGTPVNLPTNQADLNGEYTYSNLTEAVNRLNESAARQNELNASVGFATNYDSSSKEDRDRMYLEAADRDHLIDVFNDVHADYQDMDLGDHTSLILSPFTQWAKDVWYQGRPFVSDLTGFTGSSEEWKKQNKEWEMRRAAQTNARRRGWGISEENMDKTFTEMIASEGFGSSDTWSALGDFMHTLVPDALGAVLFLGRAKAAKGLLPTMKAEKTLVGKLKAGLVHPQTSSGLWLGGMGIKSGGAYYAALEERTDLTKGEKLMLATTVAASEILLEKTFRNTEQGAKQLFKRKPKNVEEAAKQRAKMGKSGTKSPSKWQYLSRPFWEEALEEGAQSLIEQNIDRLFAWSQGREYQGEEMNWFEFADSTIGGFMFGTVGARGAYRQWQAHSRVAESIQEKQQLVKGLKEEIDRIGDTNPGRKQQLEIELVEAQDALYNLHSIGRGFYARMSEEDIQTVSGMNQELANLKGKIAESKGKERKDLEDQFDALYKRKTDLESKYINEEDLEELQKDRPNSEKIRGVNDLVNTVVKERTEQVSKEMEEAYAEAFDEVNGAKGEINRLMQLYAQKRAEAEAMDPSDPRRSKLIAEASKYRSQARKVANRIGITGMDFVKVVEDADAGKFMEVEGDGNTTFKKAKQAEETSQDAGTNLKDNSIDIGLTGEGDVVDNTDNKLPENIASALNRLNRGWGKILKDGNVGVKYHKDMDSFYAAMIAEGGSLKERAQLELKDANGVTIGLFVPDGKGGGTIHLNNNATEEAVNEEFIHFTLLPIIENNEVSRKELFQQTLKLGGMKLERNEDGSFKVVVDPTAKDYSEIIRKVIQDRGTSYGQYLAPDAQGNVDLKSFEVEIIAGALAEMATKPKVFEQWIKKPKNESLWKRFLNTLNRIFRGNKSVKTDENVITGMEDIVSLGQKVAMAYKGKSTTVEVEQQAPAAEEVDTEARSARSARQPQKPLNTWDLLSNGGTVYFDEVVWREGSSSDYVSKVTPFEVEYKDYWHYKNDYARRTGNGIAPSRFDKPYVIHEGKKMFIKPPKPRTNKAGEVLNMEVPKRMSYTEYRIKEAAVREELWKELRLQQAALMEECGVLWREKGHNMHTNFLDFRPDNTGVEEGVEMRGVDIEGYAMMKQNIIALNASEITPDDLKALKGRSSVVSKEDFPEIYNMAGGQRQSKNTIDGHESVQGRFAIRGKKSVGKLSAEQLASLQKVQGSDIGAVEDFDGAFMFTLGYDSTMILDEDDATGVRSMADTNEVMSNRRVSSAVRTQERILRMMLKDINRKDIDPLGYVLVAFTTQGEANITASPRVFNETLDLITEKAQTDPSVLKNFNSLFTIKKDDSSSVKAQKRRAVKIVREATARNNDAYSKRLLLEKAQGKTTLSIENVEDLEVAISALKSETFPGSGVFLENENTSFEYRNDLLTRILKNKKLGLPTKKEIIEKYKDPIFGEAKSGAIVAVKKVPYKTIDNEDGSKSIDPDSIPKIETDMTRTFRHGIVSESATNEPLVFLEEQYLIGDILPRVKREMSAQRARGGAEGKIKAPAAEATIQLKPKDEVVSRSARQLRNNTSVDPASWTLNERTSTQRMMDIFKQRIVDKYNNIHNLQKDIEESRGGRVRKEEDFKMNEELLYGKAAYDLERLEKKLDEITSLMKETNVKEKELSMYMYALHAKERNKVILERGGKKDGSGMSDAEADSILKNISPERKTELDKIVKKVREIQQNTRETYINLGMETQETIDVWDKQWENYVPLQGIATDDMGDGKERDPYSNKGLNVTKSMIKKAKGRGTAAENILAQIINQNAQAHINGRTNEALRSLYELVKNNPNPKVWKIVEGKPGQDLSRNENVVGVRVDGKQQYIYFNDASYAETLRNMNVPVTGLLVKALRVPGNWLRRSFTTLNPEFVLSNFSRDIQAALFNAAAEAEIEGGILNGTGVVKDIMRLTPQTLKALLKGSIGKDMDPLIAKYFEDFQADGGRTGWAYAKDLETIAEEIESETSDEKTTAQKIIGKAKNFGKLVEGVNDAFENSIRLSAYIAARENGVSREKAAQFAKNITVNFNKHGEWGQALNAVYLFFNASVQGTARLGRSLLGSKPPRPDGVKENWFKRRTNAQKMAAGLAIFNSLLTMLNIALSDDDEDGISFYEKIPDYVKERNLIIMIPGGAGGGKDYIKIPMPYGFNVFANLGSASTEVAYGKKEIDESLLFLFNSFVSSFSPISFGQSENIGKYALKAISPTVLKPLVEVGVNETYFGSPVYKEQSPFGAPKPGSHMSFRSPDSVQQFFKWMNEATGGTAHRSGALDMNPDSLWYMFEYFLGGAGQFVTRTGETVFKIGARFASGENLKVEYNDLPFIRKMYGEPGKYYDFELYYKNKEEIEISIKEIKDPDITFVAEKYQGVTALHKQLKNAEKQLKAIRAAKREAKNIEGYVERTLRIQELMDKERKILMFFNEQYEKLRKR